MPFILILLLCAVSLPAPAVAVQLVYDASNSQHQLKQLAQMTQQLQHLREQLQQARALTQQAKQQYEALSGIRNLGDLFHERRLYQALPSDWQQFYNHSAELVQTMQDICSREQWQGDVNELLPLMNKRQQDGLVGHMAMTAEAYKVADQRIAQLERLMQQINRAVDCKAIQDLQARIHIEQGLIQNDLTKIQLAGQWQKQQQRLMDQQREQLSQRILSPTNSAMPILR